MALLKDMNIILVFLIICSNMGSLINTYTWKERNHYYSTLKNFCLPVKKTETAVLKESQYIKIF